MGNEVENILNEIRERVRRDQAQLPATNKTTNGGSPISTQSQPNATGNITPIDSEFLNRLAAHLTTTSRAWDRLPPLNSNRKGGPARLELWLKTRLKAMSRWFIWEQVNFNSAVHHALAETLHALSAYQQELAALRIELAKQAETSREGFERGIHELAALRARIESQTTERKKEIASLCAGLSAHNAAVDARSAAIEARVGEIATEVTRKLDEARAEVTPQLAELAGELRESDAQLREEQRVCFKQLSLEASETAVNEERGRRLIEARLKLLEEALANLQK